MIFFKFSYNLTDIVHQVNGRCGTTMVSEMIEIDIPVRLIMLFPDIVITPEKSRGNPDCVLR